MITKDEIIQKALELGYGDIGFTTAERFNDHEKYLTERYDKYDWTEDQGIPLKEGIDPCAILPDAKTIIVLIEPYFKQAYPKSMEAHFGRCYLDDDRITKDGLHKRTKAFRQFLSDAGIASKVPFNLPHRVAAARAGLGTFGKNCLFYSNKVVRHGSWTLPIAIVINEEFSPGTPFVGTDCPSWCRNACIAACPTHALEGSRKINPRKCISFLTYFGETITPMELREPMGMNVYGCDRCQDVCPRNQPWLSQELPMNEKVVAKAKDFDLSLLLHMDEEYFTAKIWPHMFYMGKKTIWKWKMNVARVMGNSRDPKYLLDLEKALNENTDERILGMAAWAMGQIGNNKALKLLTDYSKTQSGLAIEEIKSAIQTIEKNQ